MSRSVWDSIKVVVSVEFVVVKKSWNKKSEYFLTSSGKSRNNMRTMPTRFYTEMKARLGEEKGRGRAGIRKQYAASVVWLRKKGIKADQIERKLKRFELSMPSWALSAGGTRFFRFEFPGEPRDVWEKVEDASIVNLLTGMAPRVSLHYPWDKVADPEALARYARRLGLKFDAINSNTFQDHPGQKLFIQVREPLQCGRPGKEAGD